MVGHLLQKIDALGLGEGGGVCKMSCAVNCKTEYKKRNTEQYTVTIRSNVKGDRL